MVGSRRRPRADERISLSASHENGTFILFTLRISGRNHANSVLSPDHAPSHETDFTARSLAVLFLFSFLRRLSGRWLICFFDDDGKGDQIWIVHKPIEESRC